MKNIIFINEIINSNKYIDNEVKICGWIRTVRNFKSGISFLMVYDGSCFKSIQVIIKNNLLNYNKISKLTTGCSVMITGIVKRAQKSEQLYEIYAIYVKVLGLVDIPDEYPMSSKYHSLEHLRNFAHLRSRTNLIGAVSRIRNTIFQAINNFMDRENFIWVPTPLITTVDSEGLGQMFKVSTLDFKNLPKKLNGNIDYKKDFFGKEVFLTVSGQLTVESYACAISKVYTLGPTFRAEHSNTSRHLAEFWMLEPEVAFANLKDIMYLSEKMIKHIIKFVITNNIDDMEFLGKRINLNLINRLNNILKIKFIHINYTDVINILKKFEKNFQNPVEWGKDLYLEHEKFLSDKYFNLPIIIKNYPKNIKAFYMRVNSDNKTVAAMDILMPDIGEIIGGSQREERLNYLDQRLNEMKIKKENYWWYRDLRRYGTIPHSGFGLGLERLLLYITGLQNIRDVIPFPRTNKDANF
ncbi:MAG: asparagine--tRNA ligase [Enterobacterales bacterium]